MRSDRQTGSGADPCPGRGYRRLAARIGSSLHVRRPYSVPVESSRHLRVTLLVFAVSAGTLLLVGSPALAQTGYTGIPPTDTYVGPVDTYVGLGGSPRAGVALSAPTPQGSTGGMITVGTEGLDGPPETLSDGRRNLVSGWDLITIAAVGLTVAVGFARSTGRFPSR